MSGRTRPYWDPWERREVSVHGFRVGNTVEDQVPDQIVLTKQSKKLDREEVWSGAESQLLSPRCRLLREAHRLTRMDGALGVDAASSEEFSRSLESNLRVLCKEARDGVYRAPPVRLSIFQKTTVSRGGLEYRHSG